MKSFFERDFDLLEDKKERIFLVAICAIVGTIFIMVYNPLDVSRATLNELFGIEIPFFVAGIIGGLSIAFSQLIVRPLFDIRLDSIKKFVAWFAFEMILMSFVLFVFYGDKRMGFVEEFRIVLIDAIMVAMVPYGFALLALALYKKSQTGQRVLSLPQGFISIKDENGRPVLTMREEDFNGPNS